MKLKLRDNKITVIQTGLENLSQVPVKYDYELNTNHLYEELNISYDKHIITYKGPKPHINLDIIPDRRIVKLTVNLKNNIGHIIKQYETSFVLFKSYTLDDNLDMLNIYNEYNELKEKYEQLLNEGEVI